MRNLTNMVGLSAAAEILEVDRETVRRWVRSGKLRAVRAPGGIRAPYMVDRRDIAAIAAQRPEAVAS